jgi:hypothetical protein
VPVDVVSEIVIARPPAEVSSFAADPDNAPGWYINIKGVEWKTPRPVRVGTQVAFVARFLGRRLAYTYGVSEFRPGEKLVMATVEGPFPMETTYEWGPAAEGSTRMRLRNRGSPTGLARVAAPLVAAAMARANRKDLARLKGLLERGQA